MSLRAWLRACKCSRVLLSRNGSRSSRSSSGVLGSCGSGCTPGDGGDGEACVEMWIGSHQRPGGYYLSLGACTSRRGATSVVSVAICQFETYF